MKATWRCSGGSTSASSTSTSASSSRRSGFILYKFIRKIET